MADTLLDVPTTAPASPAGLTAKHLVAMLRRHYQPENRPPAGIFAPEIGSPDGRRRADLIWMPTTVAGGNGLHGHEIKVTRADLITELDDPTKADPWAKYCTRWWLVLAHPSLATGLDIPANWGVMAPPSGRRTRTMTVVKPAPELAPTEPSVALAKLAAWQMYATHDTIDALRRDLGQRDRQLVLERDEVSRLRANGTVTTSREAQKVAGIVEAIRVRVDRDELWLNVPDETIVEAVVDHAATAAAAKTLRRQMAGLVADVERVLDPFRRVLPELRQAERLAAQPDTGFIESTAAVVAAFPRTVVA